MTFKFDNSTLEGLICNWEDYRNTYYMEYCADPKGVANDFINFAATSYEEYNAMWEVLRDIEKFD